MRTNLLIGANSITNNLDNVASDLALIIQQIGQEESSKFMEPKTRKYLSRFASHMLKSKSVYDQIRYINKTGMEIIRTDYNSGKPVIVTNRSLLQDKSQRYYFKESIELDQGEIYYSPFDLNIEHGKIEIPYKPVIRIATPVFDSKRRKRGIIILNYLGEKLISDFKAVSDNAFILNSDGYWLNSFNPGLEWGFMFGKEETFAKRFPGSWHNITGAQKGHFRDNNGLFVFQTLYPISKMRMHRTAFNKSRTLGAEAKEWKPYFWILVSWVPNETLNSMGRDEIKETNFFFALIYIIMIIIIMGLTYIRLRYIKSKGTIEEMEASIKKNEALFKRQTELINEQLYNAIETFPDGFVLYDPDDRLLMCNKAFREMWSGIDDLIKPGVYFHELAAAIESRGLANKGEAAKKRNWVIDRFKHGFEDEFLEIQLADGRWILHHDHRTKDGSHVGIRIDLTERKLAEDQLRRVQKMEALGQLTGGIAHDFNNILSIIQGSLELIQYKDFKKDPILKNIENALKATQRGADITKKLLSFSRKELGRVSLHSLGKFIKDLEELLAKSLTVSIKVDTHLAEDLWPVALDPGDLEDAILNLSINARDAMPNGGRLIIEASNKVLDESYAQINSNAAAGEYVMISVSDTGVGMSKEVKDKALEPFFTTKEKGKGTGLGLSMVYGFVQRSGGHIKIYSKVGEGTSIRIFLPRTHKDVDGTDTAYDFNVEFPRGIETILIVDDEDALVEIAASHLEDLGYTTFVANDGKQALQMLLNNKNIDLLFTDIIMPGDFDGYQLALAAHEEHPTLKILLASGFTEKRFEYIDGGNKYLAQLSSDILNKPYNKYELSLAVRSALNDKAAGCGKIVAPGITC